jgi:hypothetical protein
MLQRFLQIIIQDRKGTLSAVTDVVLMLLSCSVVDLAASFLDFESDNEVYC